MKAYTPHRSVHWLTFVSAQTQFSDQHTVSFQVVLLWSHCPLGASISVAWCFCPPQAELSGVELLRSLSILELSCLLKTARIYFSLITITLVSGNFAFTGITPIACLVNSE